MLAAAVALVALPLAAASLEGVRVGPVEKVMEMLETMITKAKKGKQEEAVQFTAYKQYCLDEEGAKQEDVKEMNLEIEQLKAAIQKHEVDIEDLGAAIVDHKADIEEFKNSTANATEARKEERESYEVMHQDYSESVTACQQAIEVLSKENYKRPGKAAAALLQKLQAKPSVPAQARKVLQLYLAQTGEEPDPLSVRAPVANAYEFQSHSILDMLKDLKRKFEDERRELEKDEMKQRHSYEMLTMDYRNSLAAAEHELTKKEKIKGDVEVALAEAQGQLADVTASRDSDMKFLEDLKTTCTQKFSDFDAREKLRGEEIEALSKAVGILRGDAVSGAAKEHLRSLAQKSAARTGTALVQTRGASSSSGAVAQRLGKAAAYLQARSSKLDSMMLAATAARAREDPFDKVKKMIQDLIARLQAQQDEEAEHKEWCDGELDTNKQTRDAKTKEVETLHGTIDQLQNDIAVLKRSIARLSEEIAELQKAMATAEELRSKEQAENQDTIAEAVDAQSALSEAIQTLKDFYERAGAATSLAQQSHSQAPAIFNEPYKGQQTANNNVLAFLDVIQSDFARLEQETTDAENTASQEHEDYMSDSKLDRDNKEADMKKDKDTLVSKKEDLDTATTELDNAQQELDAALEYYDKLKPSCIGTQETGTSDYNARVQRREEEIASLKEALTILSGEAVPGPGGAPAEALYSGVDGGNRGYDVGIVAGQ